jgi:hypothetical protein
MRANSKLDCPSPANDGTHGNFMETTMVSHLPLRSTFDGFLAVAAFAPMLGQPSAARDVGAPSTADPYKSPKATTLWSAPRATRDDGATMSGDPARLADLGSTEDGGGPLLQLVAERQRGSTLRQTGRARRR